jgi:cytochrome P450
VGAADLAHLPAGDVSRFSVLGTLRVLRDPLAAARRNVARAGRVYRNHAFGHWNVSLVGPEANELVFGNKEGLFSSELGWNPLLERLFPRGLMLMDGAEHRVHRATLSVAFKPAPMQRYLADLSAGIARHLAQWDALPPRGAPAFRFYPAVKRMTLDLAATSFLGIAWGPEADAINRAFVDMVAASVGIVRVPLPGTAMGRGVAGRRFMCRFFAREIPRRRGTAGEDIFTRICNATREDGGRLTDQEVIDHMNFLMMAAHDTITSSLTSMVYLLGRHPEWQERLRAEVLALRSEVGEALPYERLGELELVERVFKESLRLIPPVPSLPRRALRDFEFMGHRIPAGTPVNVSPMMTHRLPDVWPEPDRFDPDRFLPEAARGRHRQAWVPFGAGAHVCLGLQFAYMQAKAFFFQLLAHHRVVLTSGGETAFTLFPIPKPKDGLPVRLERV